MHNARRIWENSIELTHSKYYCLAPIQRVGTWCSNWPIWKRSLAGRARCVAKGRLVRNKNKKRPGEASQKMQNWLAWVCKRKECPQSDRRPTWTASLTLLAYLLSWGRVKASQTGQPTVAPPKWRGARAPSDANEASQQLIELTTVQLEPIYCSVWCGRPCRPTVCNCLSFLAAKISPQCRRRPVSFYWSLCRMVVFAKAHKHTSTQTDWGKTHTTAANDALEVLWHGFTFNDQLNTFSGTHSTD